MSDDSLDSELFKRKIMVSILKFLHDELKDGGYDAENSEGLEVAVQCLESIYKVNANSFDEPSIASVYKHYIRTNVLMLPDPCDETKLEAENLKSQGNTAMTQQQFADAITFYSRALKLNPKNAIYYCNRAAAYSRINNHRAAIKDCEMAIEIDGAYSKAYGRLGLAYTGLEDYKKAVEFYEIALTLDPKNESYAMNYTQAKKKMSEMNTSSPAGASGSGASASGASNANTTNINVSSMLNNQELMHFAAQMLSDPTMVHVMRNLVSGSMGNDDSMVGILQAGQQLAQLIQNDHPALLEELRQRISDGPPLLGADANSANLETQPDSMEEDERRDSQSSNSSQKNSGSSRKRPST